MLIHLAMSGFVTSVAMRPDNLLAPLLRIAPIALIGVVSYGMYLLHMFVRHGVVALTSRLGDPPGLLFVLLLPGTWVAAELSFRLYETPFLKMKSRWVRTG